MNQQFNSKYTRIFFLLNMPMNLNCDFLLRYAKSGFLTPRQILIRIFNFA